MNIRILGRDWHLEFVRLRNARGKCQHPESVWRRIQIHKPLKGEERLEVLLHEMLHAAGWHIDEGFVEEFAADAAKVLWELGYRDEA